MRRRGILVSIPLDKAGFVDPDGDELTFALSASRDDIYAAGDGLLYGEIARRVFFLAKTACALAEVDLLSGEVYETVVTMTATDPDGESAQVSVMFPHRSDPDLGRPHPGVPDGDGCLGGRHHAGGRPRRGGGAQLPPGRPRRSSR